MKRWRIRCLSRLATVVVPSILGLRFLAGAQELDAGPKKLYETHQWFQLRDELRFESEALPLYRGALAAAFNQQDAAERLLRPLIAAQTASDAASEARQWLVYLHFRSGQYREALTLLDDELKAKPDSGPQGFRTLLSGFSQNQSSVRVAPSRVSYRLDSDLNLLIPVLVSGHSGEYLVDSDANVSMIAESEAKRLGLPVRSVGPNTIRMSGAAGQGFGNYRVTVAEELAIGNVHLRNVAFLVMPDTTMPFRDLSEGRRAILGIPVLLGLQAMRWSNNGIFEIDFAPSRPNGLPGSNLCFDGSDPVTLGEYNGRPIQLLVDTGSKNTDLWPKFAREMPASLKESATRSKWRLKGVDGAIEVDSLSVKQCAFNLGRYSAVLSPAHVLLEGASTNDWYDARLGMDVLSKGHRVTIDFRTMTLTIG